MEGQLVCVTPRCDDSAPRAAREAFSHVEGVGWQLGDAMLVASELVTNAVRHSGCRDDDRLTISLYRNGDHLCISVTDPGASGRRPQISEDDLGFGGLGMRLVGELTTSWRSERRGDGHEVWARLPIVG